MSRYIRHIPGLPQADVAGTSSPGSVILCSGPADSRLDFSEPVAVILIFVMHFVPDDERPYDVVRRLMEPLPPGSYLVMAHAASDIAADFMAAGADAYNDSQSLQGQFSK